MKKIIIDKTVYELTEEYPELIEFLKELGFLGVANPVLRNTLGRVTTLRQGCEKMGKDLGEVTAKLREKGFIVE